MVLQVLILVLLRGYRLCFQRWPNQYLFIPHALLKPCHSLPRQNMESNSSFLLKFGGVCDSLVTNRMQWNYCQVTSEGRLQKAVQLLPSELAIVLWSPEPLHKRSDFPETTTLWGSPRCMKKSPRLAETVLNETLLITNFKHVTCKWQYLQHARPKMPIHPQWNLNLPDEALGIMEQKLDIPAMSYLNSSPTESMSIQNGCFMPQVCGIIGFPVIINWIDT